MTANKKIKLLAEIVRGIVRGLHEDARECLLCPLRGTDACAGYGGAYEDSGAYETLDKIIKGCRNEKQ
jgi:hypothetical protein